MKRIFVIVLFFLSVASAKGQNIKAVKATDVEKIIAESRTPLIVNMWATWCQPCLEEIPYFLEEVKKYNASVDSADIVHLLFVSLDFEEAFPAGIAAVAKKRKINAPIVWLDETNADYFCPKIDSKWSGAIPATLFINIKTGYRNFIEEKIPHEQLKKEIMAMLK